MAESLQTVGLPMGIEEDRVVTVRVTPVPPTGAEKITYVAEYKQHGRNEGDSTSYDQLDGTWNSGSNGTFNWVWVDAGRGETEKLLNAVHELMDSLRKDLLVAHRFAAGGEKEVWRKSSSLIAMGYIDGELHICKLLEVKAFKWSEWVAEETVIKAQDRRVMGWGISDYPFK